MATPIGFREANKVLQPPAGVPNCVSLEVYQDETQSITRWQLNDEEIEELKKNGGKIYVWILGAQPPIDVCTKNPFDLEKT